MGICCSKQRKQAKLSDYTTQIQVQILQVPQVQMSKVPAPIILANPLSNNSPHHSPQPAENVSIEALISSVNSKNIKDQRISQNKDEDIQKYKGTQVQNYISEPTYLLTQDDFDPEGNCIFPPKSEVSQYRGGKIYNKPVQPWLRIGLNVKLKQYENDSWLTRNGAADEWPVAFHGLKNPEYVLPKIIHEGLRQEPGQGFQVEVGNGIYCSPEIDFTESYSGILEIEGQFYKTVMQCRVQHSKIKQCPKPGYWVINDSKYIRPYGICFKQVEYIEQPLPFQNPIQIQAEQVQPTLQNQGPFYSDQPQEIYNSASNVNILGMPERRNQHQQYFRMSYNNKRLQKAFSIQQSLTHNQLSIPPSPPLRPYTPRVRPPCLRKSPNLYNSIQSKLTELRKEQEEQGKNESTLQLANRIGFSFKNGLSTRQRKNKPKTNTMNSTKL